MAANSSRPAGMYIYVRRRINSSNLIDVLADAMIEHGSIACTGMKGAATYMTS
jgi:hypothetical protein